MFGDVLIYILCSPDSGSAVILIGAGEYEELVNVTRTGPLTLLVRNPEHLFLLVGFP